MIRAELHIPDASPEYCETAEDVLGFVSDRPAACALGVITRVTGGSSRAVGSLFAVAQDGTMAGYVSNGCIDADLRLQALAILAEGRARTLIYGAGSPFVDLRLPCGGSVEVLIDPQPDASLCRQALAMLEQRRTVTLAFDRIGGLAGLSDSDNGADDRFRTRVFPRLRLVIAGRGAPVEKLARLLSALDFPALVATPNPDDRLSLGTLPGMAFEYLTSPDHPPCIGIDRWTAVLLLFHDHEWEAALLAACLPHDPFYIGALGSRTTHLGRRQALLALGVPQSQIDRVRGPVGLIPAVRNSTYLAVSVIAEITAAYIEATSQAAPATQPG